MTTHRMILDDELRDSLYKIDQNPDLKAKLTKRRAVFISDVLYSKLRKHWKFTDKQRQYCFTIIREYLGEDYIKELKNDN